MSRVFICHAAEDRPVAGRIVEALEDAGIACWIAPRDVTAGADYAAAIVTALEDSGLVVLVLSDAANGSPHVRREIERAASLDRTIVPIRLADVPPSKSLQYYVSDAHWYNAYPGSIDTHLRAVVDDITAQMVALGLIHGVTPAGPQAVEMVTVATALTELTARYGNELADDPRRVRALLLDVAGDSPTLTAAAVAAAEIGVGEVLLSTAMPMLAAVRVRLVHRLQRERALSGDMAQWAVDAWADALGLAAGPDSPDIADSGSPTEVLTPAVEVDADVPDPATEEGVESVLQPTRRTTEPVAPLPPSERPVAGDGDATRATSLPPDEHAVRRVEPPAVAPPRSQAKWWLAAAAIIVVVGVGAAVLSGGGDGNGAGVTVAGNTTTVPTTAGGGGGEPPVTATTEPTATSVGTTSTTAAGGDPIPVAAGNPSLAEPAPGEMVIDGIADDWAGRFLYTSSATVFGASAIDGSGDLGAGWRLAWDESYLYFYVVVVDDVIVQENTGSNLFRGDAVAFYFDADLSDHAAGAGLSSDDVAFFIAPTGPSGTPNWVRLLPVASGGAFGSAGAITSDPGVGVAVAFYTGGYVIEGKIAWDVLMVGGAAEAGDLFRMTLDVSDNDEPGTSQQQSMVSNSPGRTLEQQAMPEVWEVLMLDNPQQEFFRAAPAVFGLDGDLTVDLLGQLGFNVFTVSDTCGAGTPEGSVYRVSAGGGQQLDGPDVDPQPVIATNLLLTVFITNSAVC